MAKLKSARSLRRQDERARKSAERKAERDLDRRVSMNQRAESRDPWGLTYDSQERSYRALCGDRF